MGRSPSVGGSFGKMETKSSSSMLEDENDRPFSIRLREALFNVFMQMNKDTSIYHLLVTLYFIVDGLQMLAFPLNQNPHMPFASMPLGKSIFSVLGAVTFMPSPRGGPTAFYGTEIMYIITIVWVILNLLLLGYSVWLYLQRDDFINGITVYRPNWPIRALRTCARVSTLALFVDIFSILLMPFDCASNEPWGNSAMDCWAGTHILFVVLSVLFLPLFFLYAVLVAGMYIDRRPDPKRNLLSQAHGRVAVGIMFLKAILCTVFVFGSGTASDNWFLYIVALVVGLAWLIAYARFLPYHQPWLNEFQCGIAGIYTAAAISGLLANGLDDPAHSVGAWTWLFTAPLAAFVGWAIAYASRRSYVRRRELGSPFMVEIKARAMINDLSESESNFGMSRTDENGHHSKRGNGRYDSSIIIQEKDARMRDVQILYDDALTAFTGSSILELFLATFLGYVRRNRHLELLHLRAAEAKADTSAIDIRFFVWERLALIDEEEASSNTVKTSVLRRLQFDKLQSESENLSMKARQLILDFWTESCEKRPDMGRMQAIGTDIIATIRQCDNIFRQLMEMAPQSTAVMRSYADFLLEIANDPKKALELLQAAEQIEEDESKAHAGTESDTKEYPFMASAPDFDLSNENVALIRISGEPGRLGIIQDANPAALKMFGYGRRELIGKNIDSVVPEPVSTVHQKFLEKYMSTGEETVVNTSRIYYGLHRNGYVFQMSANIRPMEGGFGGVLEEIVTSQANLIFCGEWGRWKVTAACKTSMALLGITLNDLKVGNITIDKLLPGITQGEKHKAIVDDSTVETPAANTNAGRHDFTMNHSPLMNELINSNNSPGPGIDISFNVIQWSAAAAAVARSQRRTTHHLSPGGYNDAAEHDRFAAATAVIKRVPATAKLQELAISFLPGPCYFLRWRIAKGTETVEDVTTPIEDVTESGSVNSNDVQGSDNDSDSAEKDENVRSPLLQKVMAASSKKEIATVTPRLPPNISATPSHAQNSARRVSISMDKPIVVHTIESGDVGSPPTSPIGANGLPGHVHPLPLPTTTTTTTERNPDHAPILKSALSSARMKSTDRNSGVFDGREPSVHKTHSISWGHDIDAVQVTESSVGINAHETHSDTASSAHKDDKGVKGLRVLNHSDDDEFGEIVKAGGAARKKAGSIQSGSSAGSSTITDALRKGISQRSRSMESSLIGLRRSLITIFAFVGLMNIASLIVTHVLYSDLQYDMELVAENGRRGIALQRAYSELQRLRMMADGLLLSTDNGTETRSRLELALNDLAGVHQRLYSYVDENDEEERTLYSSPTIVVEDFITGTYITRSNVQSTNRTVNLMNAGLEFIAKARQVLARTDLSLNIFNETSGSMFWLLTNGPIPIRNAFNASMIIADKKTAGVATTIMLANVIVLGIALGLLVLVTGMVMVPSINAVLLQKATVFTVFLETPMPILRSLRARTETKIVALRRATEEADAGLDVGGAGEADEEEIEREAAAMATAAAVSSHIPDGKKSSNKTSKHKKTHEKRTFKRTTTVGVATTARFSWPMLILAGYYIGTYFWKQETAYASEYATSEVFHSHQVEFFVGQSNYNIRNVFAYCDPVFVEDQHVRFERLLDNLESEQDALLYGSEELHVRPLLKDSTAHFHLFMENGCIDNNNQFYTMDDCLVNFFDGLVGKGLQGAYKQYVELTDRKMDERVAAAHSPNCEPGDVNNGIAVVMENLAERYLATGFHASAQYTLDNINTFLNTFKVINILVTVASIIALSIFFFVVYQPMIRRMDTEIKNVRFLLLLFPDEVSRVVPAIIAAGRDLLKEGHISAGSSVASGSSGAGGGGGGNGTPSNATKRTESKK